MADQFVGEIRLMACNFAPSGWAMCNGQIMAISQNTALFSLLGTTYGGNGASTFALPNLQGRAIMHPDQGSGLTSHYLGETGGTESVTLTKNEMPAHNHRLLATHAIATTSSPANAAYAVGANAKPQYGPASGSPGTMHASTLVPTGNGTAHNNMQPFLAMNFVIALNGIFPSRS
ncbi:phage tail protein [Undibacterium danionis]|uniref:Phage tail protein n=1 Tax=Undibacterium danionis TaxID=1812100 RepID=A0ABV6ILI3_9BURK